MQAEQKSELRKAYDRVDTLKLELNAKQFIELSNILYDLATNEFQNGLHKGYEISAM
jgi:hypothetical protein